MEGVKAKKKAKAKGKYWRSFVGWNVLSCLMYVDMADFVDSEIWKKGIVLVREVYELTKKIPREELYGLTTQIRKSSTSILANFAEGYGRHTPDDKAHKYTISRGECSETEAFLHIIVALGFHTNEETARARILVREIGKMLSGLIHSYRIKS